MAVKKSPKADSLTFPLRRTTEINVLAVSGQKVWLSLVKNDDTQDFMNTLQFQKAVQDEHGWFYYDADDEQLEASITEWLPKGFYCESGEIFCADGALEPISRNYWPLIVFLLILLGGHLM